MNRVTRLRFPAIFFSVFAFCMSAGAQSLPENLLSGLVWRNIGPFRGGRVSAVSGAVGQPGVYYMGLPMGGVWKTTSAGATWFPIFDAVKEASSVGAVQVAPSDPKVVYVGMGDMVSGGGISRGNGVYKSTDAGATWHNVGLNKTEHIPSILVDPHDPNLVMVAAQGPINANPGQTPASPEGPLALPGVYTLILTVDGQRYTQTVTVKNDPRSPATAGDLREQHELQMNLYHCVQETWGSYHQIADTKSSLDAILKANPPSEVVTAVRALNTKLTAIAGSPGSGRRPGGGGGGGVGAPPSQPTFMAVNSAAVRRLNTLDSGDMPPSDAMRKAGATTESDLQKARKNWDLFKSTDLPAFKALLAKNNLKLDH